MKASERDFILFLEDIVESSLKIAEYIIDLDFQHFKWDRKTIDAVIRNFEVIGEATKNLPKDLKDKYPQVPWEDLYSFRNKIAHEYFGVDYEIIWQLAKKELPVVLNDIEQIIVIEKKKI